jgi:hypothetical protein
MRHISEAAGEPHQPALLTYPVVQVSRTCPAGSVACDLICHPAVGRLIRAWADSRKLIISLKIRLDFVCGQADLTLRL